MGKCQSCGAFQDFTEVAATSAPAHGNASQPGLKSAAARKPSKKASSISELNNNPIQRTATGIGELDRVLGGGFVEGEVVMLAASPGAGKALHSDTLIPLAKGGFKKLGEISKKDTIIDIHGNHTNILRKFTPDIQKAYLLTFSDGTTVSACEDHIWSLYDTAKYNTELQEKTTSQIFQENILNTEGKPKWQVPVVTINTYEKHQHEIDFQVLANFLSYREDYTIPDEILYISLPQRQEMLQALMDMHGRVEQNGKAIIELLNKPLVENVKTLIKTLGMQLQEETDSLTNEYGGTVEFHRLTFTANFDCFKAMTKHQYELNVDMSPKFNEIVGIEETNASGLYQCLMVDSPTKTFLCTENFIPTHNSTLSMSIAEKFAEMGHKVLYVSGEESEQQIGLRAKRMGVSSPLIRIVNETNVETILGHVEEEQPKLLIIDSLQTMASSELPGSMGSIQQSKEAASVFTLMAKREHIVTVLISQVTKE